MKRAFLFSVIFVLLFSVFLILSVFYFNLLQMNELNLAQTKNISRVVYTQDDITSDLLDYLQLSVSIESNSTHTILNISDVLVSPYTNPSAMLNSYESFINGTYSNQTNLLDPSTNLSVISLNTTSFESSPSLRFINSNPSLNLNYAYDNLSKSELIIHGSSLVRNYSLTIRLNSTCLNSNCTNATWAGGPPNNDTSTRALWHFDEGSGMTATDSSGNSNDGILSSDGIDWVGGRFGQGLHFDSNMGDEHIIVNDSGSLDISGNLTVELWFKKPIAFALSEWLLNKANSTLIYTDTNYAIYISQYKIRGSIANGTDVQNLTSATSIQNNTWYHVALTADGTTLKLYVNGVLENSTSQTITPAPNNQPLLIGAKDSDELSFRFNGTIDEVAVYSRAKSADEIAADANLFHWDWGPLAINNNVSGAWHFDEGSGNISYDSSGNGNSCNFNGTTALQLIPDSTHKAYLVSSTTTDSPNQATTEFSSAQYDTIDTSNDGYTTSNAIESISQSCNSPTLSGGCTFVGEGDCDVGPGECVSTWVCTEPGSWCPTLTDTAQYSSCAKSEALNCFCTYSGGFPHCSVGPTFRCTTTGGCAYFCNSGKYDTDGTDSNGCESSTASYTFGFQRYTFNISSYWDETNGVTFYWEGKYNITSSTIQSPQNSSELYWYNVTSASWVFWQTLPYNSENSYTIFFSGDNLTDLYNATSGLVQFAVRGNMSKTGHNLTIYADYAYLSVAYTFGSSWAASEFNWGAGLDGTNYAEISDSSSLDITTQQLTLEAWVKPDTISPSYQTILHKGDSSNENYGLYLKGDEVYFEWVNAGVYSAETATANLQPNTWYHIAVVSLFITAPVPCPSCVNIFVDGSLAGTGSTPAEIVANDAPLTFGKNVSTGNYFNGIIDEVAIYSRIKSADEIAADANPLYVSLDVRDALNNPVTVRGTSAGYVNPGGNNTFHLKTNNNGMLNMTAGDYTGLYSLRMYANRTRADLLIKTVQEGVSSIQAVLPVQLRIYQQTFSNLIISEK